MRATTASRTHSRCGSPPGQLAGTPGVAAPLHVPVQRARGRGTTDYAGTRPQVWGDPSAGSKASANYVCTKFQKQLEDLVGRLTAAETHYVRCIASNKLKQHLFDAKHVMKQLRYAGVMDVVKVRQSGFALRR